ncbi:restriction endonuclease [Thiomicrospira aerophila AL3]|uniref:Restriction endonuclease n=1 Tax=Thiomicrospira aerophila AL3 TaxID=717772 RepID=W0DUJ8_9GAMM|nr:restriction endonuclease subunit S [Thiomicrospira aerophila]AHF00654.1 restriction endonuclease [Thiomicrospira aerophila AL3]
MSSEFQEVIFDEFIELASEKVPVESLTLETYISTENMIPNKGGIEVASSLPNSKTVNKFVKGDTLFSNIRTYFEKVHFADFSGGASPDVLIFRTKSAQKLLPEYLYYIASNKDFIDFTVRTSKGAKMPRGDKGAIQGHKLLLPPLSTQQRISDILRTLDKKITLNRQINQTLEAMAQAMFKSWFVDFEPVKAKMQALENSGTEDDANLAAMQAISGKTADQLATLKTQHPDQYQQLHHTASLFPSAMQDSELGEIPAGWEVKSLDTMAHYQNGLALQKFRPEDENDFLPVVKIAQLKKGFTDGEEKASPNINPSCIIDDGDVVFSWSGTLVVDSWCGGKAALNQHLFKVTSDDHPKWFYYYFTKHHLDEFQRIAQAKAVTMGHIKREHLKKALCAVPDSDLIAHLGQTIKPLLDKAVAVRLENRTLTELRDTLLPKLLSGELQISTEDVA